MKRIGIITVHRLPNWGSAMQAYALQKVLNSFGYESECIDYLYPNEWHIKRGCWHLETPWRLKLLRLLGLKPKSLQNAIDSFIEREVHVSRKYASFDDIHNNPPLYDIYMTGSDQIWNWKTMYADSTYLLDFAPADKPRLAYSSSFSVKSIPEDIVGIYKTNLEKFSYISVREKQGADIVNKLIGKPAEVVLDPTMLIPKEDWLTLSRKANWKSCLPDHFILCYILDYTFNPRKKLSEILSRLQQDLKIPVIIIGREFDEFTNNRYYFNKRQTIGVYEFLDLVSKADYFVTTSFHGTAFSVKLQKNFITLVEKEDQEDDRILSFLSNIGLERHIVSLSTDISKWDFNNSFASSKNEKLDSLVYNCRHRLKAELDNV